MYTKGKWSVEKRVAKRVFGHTTHIVSEDGSHIAEVSPCAIEDNAKLISAAPDLLNACKEAKEQIAYLRKHLTNKERRFTTHTTDEAYKILNDAISKAIG